MNPQYKPQPSQLPTDVQTLSGNQLPIFSQVPKGIHDYSKTPVKQVIIDGQEYTHCPFEERFIPGKPKIINSPDAPKITNKDGPAIYSCSHCGKVLATVGTPLYNTGLGGNILPSSNKTRVAPRS